MEQGAQELGPGRAADRAGPLLRKRRREGRGQRVLFGRFFFFPLLSVSSTGDGGGLFSRGPERRRRQQENVLRRQRRPPAKRVQRTATPELAAALHALAEPEPEMIVYEDAAALRRGSYGVEQSGERLAGVGHGFFLEGGSSSRVREPVAAVGSGCCSRERSPQARGGDDVPVPGGRAPLPVAFVRGGGQRRAQQSELLGDGDGAGRGGGRGGILLLLFSFPPGVQHLAEAGSQPQTLHDGVEKAVVGGALVVEAGAGGGPGRRRRRERRERRERAGELVNGLRRRRAGGRGLLAAGVAFFAVSLTVRSSSSSSSGPRRSRGDFAPVHRAVFVCCDRVSSAACRSVPIMKQKKHLDLKL